MKCKICNKEMTKPWWDKPAEGICGDCNFWYDVYAETLNLNQLHFTLEMNGQRIHLQANKDDALVDKEITDLQFLGFGGADWYLQDVDGQVHHYNNLWSRGDVPPEFYIFFPVDTIQITKEEFLKKSQQ